MVSLILLTLLSSSIDSLEVGEAKLREGKWEEAITSFKEVAMSDLGEPARATAYWNMYIAYSALSNSKEAGQSLFMFRELSLMFKEYLVGKTAGHPGFIWINRADIDKKLVLVDTMLNIYWMRGHKYSCRSLKQSCRIPVVNLIGYYATKLPFCGDAGIQDIQTYDAMPNIFMTAICKNHSTEQYYFYITQ